MYILTFITLQKRIVSTCIAQDNLHGTLNMCTWYAYYGMRVSSRLACICASCNDGGGVISRALYTNRHFLQQVRDICLIKLVKCQLTHGSTRARTSWCFVTICSSFLKLSQGLWRPQQLYYRRCCRSAVLRSVKALAAVSVLSLLIVLLY